MEIKKHVLKELKEMAALGIPGAAVAYTRTLDGKHDRTIIECGVSMRVSEIADLLTQL